MRPRDRPLLTDENIDPEVVAALRDRGGDVITVVELGLGGATDREIIRTARAKGRVILTHDSDFGTLAIREGEPLVGTVFLRPGHVSAAVVLAMLDRVARMAIEVEPPFLVVADRRGATVRVRVRRVEQALGPS